jgi:transglutaminase-like putative cysteine protease
MAAESIYNVYMMTPTQKTAYLENFVFAGALNPLVRNTTIAMLRGVHRDDHVERLARMHRFVRDSVPYHREPVEIFQPAATTLVDGGDCDDKVILLCAMGWSLRYPFQVVKIPDDPNDPGGHYTMRVGYGPSDEPHGERTTKWFWVETTIDALLGEYVADAVVRIFGRSPA